LGLSDVVLGTCTCTRAVLEYRLHVLVLVLVLEGLVLVLVLVLEGLVLVLVLVLEGLVLVLVLVLESWVLATSLHSYVHCCSHRIRCCDL
jgi:hypothetical protein